MGSVVNVVIHRVPIMLQRAWYEEVCTYLKGRLPDKEAFANDDGDFSDHYLSDHLLAEAQQPEQQPYQSRSTYSLFWPPSACPHCHTPIKPYDNIPLLSWLLLRGRCRSCQQPIALRYPLVELAGGLWALLLALFFPSWLMLAGALLFGAFLLALAVIDHNSMLLPDQLTLPLLWLGLLFNLANSYVELSDAVVGAVAGYLSLWLIYWGFKLISGREGLGYGDFKLLAALGAWLGWRILPQVVVIAALIGIVLACYRRWRHGYSLEAPLPFGSALAIAGLVCLLLWHSEIINRL